MYQPLLKHVALFLPIEKQYVASTEISDVGRNALRTPAAGHDRDGMMRILLRF